MSTQNLTEAFAVVEKLSLEEKLQLIEYVVRQLRTSSQLAPRRSWRDVRGLGKEIWEGIAVDKYIDDLRNEWDR